MLIALYERAVGFYASLVGINAYHQPGVEAGKKAAGAVLALQQKILKLLADNQGKRLGVDEIAERIGAAKTSSTSTRSSSTRGQSRPRCHAEQRRHHPFAATYGRSMDGDKQKIGLIGLAVMGENLSLNIEENGFPVAVYNAPPEQGRRLRRRATPGKKIHGTSSPKDSWRAAAARGGSS